jgi:hypothetical protein
MPIKGLRKFLNAASQLFDQRQSQCELLSLKVQGDAIVARWKMNAVLSLPWKPRLPEVIGTTIYHLDADNLISIHEETWDISATEAFFRTKWLDFSKGMASHSYGGK